MIQDGMDVNLGDLLCSLMHGEYVETSHKRQESTKDAAEVGLIDSTQRMGKPCTRGSDQR
ncbi:MAG: hypothetical protein K0R24_997 [Gammaproteobacteria bacterium]|jgi:hypothetical protein|nr:hypothetical protein [Gammaproteobacteria bacterium]